MERMKEGEGEIDREEEREKKRGREVDTQAFSMKWT